VVVWAASFAMLVTRSRCPRAGKQFVLYFPAYIVDSHRLWHRVSVLYLTADTGSGTNGGPVLLPRTWTCLLPFPRCQCHRVPAPVELVPVIVGLSRPSRRNCRSLEPEKSKAQSLLQARTSYKALMQCARAPQSNPLTVPVQPGPAPACA
jgi:hypothetical protein